MSLKRKYDFDQLQTTSRASPEGETMTTKYIKTEEFFNDDRKSVRTSRKWKESKLACFLSIDDSDDRPSSPSHSSDEIRTFPSRNRRKNSSQFKRLPPPPSSSAAASSSSSTLTPSIPMILSLIDSLVDEKQLNNDNDENLLLTIDSLINNLKHLREKIQTIHHDDAYPLNLTKPKLKSQTNEEIRPSPTHTTATAAAANHFQLPSTLFSSQPFFSPFAGKNRLSSSIANRTHLF